MEIKLTGFYIRAILAFNWLLDVIVKPNVLEGWSNSCKLNIIDLKSDENLLPLDKINAGFAVLDAVEKLKKDVDSATQLKKFIKDIRKFILAMLKNVFEKSMLGSSLVRAAATLNQTSC